MDEAIQRALKTETFVRTGKVGGGCINEGEAYMTDCGQVFVKRNAKKDARLMFDGESEGLTAILQTETVRVPKPLVVVDNPKGGGGAVLVMEFLDMSPLRNCAARLGEQLARMHLHNEQLRDEQPESYVDKFGFHCTTCCGYIPQDNTWCTDWITFLTEQKLQPQVDLISKQSGDRQLSELWPPLKQKIPEFFDGVDCKPALLHGDLWGGNAAECNHEPVVYDPAAFYGHSEFDLAIAKMFGGFGDTFFKAYHSVIPKGAGFETRSKLYQLFHYLNHWNHFGSGYRGSSISIMQNLLSRH